MIKYWGKINSLNWRQVYDEILWKINSLNQRQVYDKILCVIGINWR
jgi:hypothetical protein